mmetsp:Transcript_9110/g.23848  ORF Transcript_9110/g.23848 Transcript_9110/m.23848 type:complete len:246 (-) Transcript_9110:2237-2974(-)
MLGLSPFRHAASSATKKKSYSCNATGRKTETRATTKPSVNCSESKRQHEQPSSANCVAVTTHSKRSMPGPRRRSHAAKLNCNETMTMRRPCALGSSESLGGSSGSAAAAYSPVTATCTASASQSYEMPENVSPLLRLRKMPRRLYASAATSEKSEHGRVSSRSVRAGSTISSCGGTNSPRVRPLTRRLLVLALRSSCASSSAGPGASASDLRKCRVTKAGIASSLRLTTPTALSTGSSTSAGDSK